MHVLISTQLKTRGRDLCRSSQVFVYLSFLYYYDQYFQLPWSAHPSVSFSWLRETTVLCLESSSLDLSWKITADHKLGAILGQLCCFFRDNNALLPDSHFCPALFTLSFCLCCFWEGNSDLWYFTLVRAEVQVSLFQFSFFTVGLFELCE